MTQSHPAAPPAPSSVEPVSIGPYRCGDGSLLIIAYITYAWLAGESIQGWTSLMLVVVFAVWLGWFPPYGWQGPRHLVLPALALGLPADRR